MDTRLINQVVEWEWRIQRENEKEKVYHSDTPSYISIAIENCGKAIKSIAQHIIDLHRNRLSSNHLSEPA